MLPECSVGVRSSLLERGSDRYTSCVSGVLARGREQFRPIASSLPGHVVVYHATGKVFLPENLVFDVVRDLTDAAAQQLPINLVGASLGGMLMPFIVEKFRRVHSDYDVDKLKVLLVDAPCGLASLSDPMAGLLKHAPLASTATFLTKPLPFFQFMAVPPKEDEITVEPFMKSDNTWSTVKEAKQRVIQRAEKALKGHSLSLLLRETRWMVDTGNDGSLERAVKSLADVDVVYLVCTMGKDNPVKQPIAVDWYRERLPDMVVDEVDGTHCGFLQNKPQFAAAFERHLPRE